MSVHKTTPTTVEKSVDDSNIKSFRVIVLGDSGVGKTTLTYRFCERKYLEKAEVTIGCDFRQRVVNLAGEDIKLKLWDTAGQERYNALNQQFYRKAQAIVIVYDVTSMESFQGLKRWVEECDRHCPDIPRIMVGNKCDGVHVVDINLAQKFADQHNMPVMN